MMDFDNITKADQATLEMLAEKVMEQQDFIDSILARVTALEANLKGRQNG